MLLYRPPFPSRAYLVKMAGKPWPGGDQVVSLTRVVTALRKALVRASRPEKVTFFV